MEVEAAVVVAVAQPEAARLLQQPQGLRPYRPPERLRQQRHPCRLCPTLRAEVEEAIVVAGSKHRAEELQHRSN